MAAPARPANASPKKQDLPARNPEPAEAPASRLSWFIGWIVVPGVVFGGIFAGGVLLGAHYPDGWIAWGVRGVASLFGG